MKIFEACKAYEGGAFMAELKRSSVAFATKRINDIDLSNEFIEYPDDNGQLVTETKYLFLIHQIDNWPVVLRDLLFDAFNEMQSEIEHIVNKKSKFDRFPIQAPIEEPKDVAIAGVPKGFKLVAEKDVPEPMDETERLNQQVKKEAEQVEALMGQRLGEAETKIQG